MSDEVFQRSSEIAASAEDLFAWHARPAAFFLLQPPWERVAVEAVEGPFGNGQRVHLRVGIWGPLRLRWLAELHSVEPGRQFCDRQVHGPFAAMNHTHRMIPRGAGQCLLEDHIAYRLPLGALGRLLAGRKIRRQFDRMFTYRHRVTRAQLQWWSRYRHQPRLRVLVTGSRGMIGNPLCWMLVCGGHQVIRLAHGHGERRRLLDGTELRWWDPDRGQLDPTDLADVDAVIHLAGESVASGRWTAAKKERIRTSRVKATELLCQTLARLPRRPATLLSASAIGWYGDRGVHELTEEDAAGMGFLSEVCQVWEAATQPAREAGIRTALLRIGVVLGLTGGALAKQVLPFWLGAGSRLGHGRQYVSWISLDDALGAIHHVLMHPELAGPVNVTAPHPVTNQEYTAVLARVLRRPAWGVLPEGAAQLLFGDLARELLLASTRVVPARLLETGFQFEYPTLAAALRHQLGRYSPTEPAGPSASPGEVGKT